jgi:dolichyl-phosphate-mannose-protein mannosyltransferase
MIPFYIHFAILTNSGPGDAFMTLKFQETLVGNKQTGGAVNIPYLSDITLKHVDTAAHLHSHAHLIPLRHPDGRVSSNGQQVNGYAHSDENSRWVIHPVDTSKYDWKMVDLNDLEKKRDVRYVRSNDLVQLRHVTTDSYLKTHDVASPLTATNMEFTTIKMDSPKWEEKFNETVFRLVLKDHPKSRELLVSRKESFKLISAQFNVALHTSKKKLLPDWGFKMQEVNGNKNTDEHGPNIWIVQDVKHKRIVNGSDIDDPPKVDTVTKLPFLYKFLELSAKMIHHNNALTSSHPYASSPITWPFVVRGVSFWEKKEGIKQIYMLGHPFTWWFAIFSIFLYGAMWIMDRLLLHRGIDDFGANVRQYWDRSIGFLLVAWGFHWIPFFLYFD